MGICQIYLCYRLGTQCSRQSAPGVWPEMRGGLSSAAAPVLFQDRSGAPPRGTNEVGREFGVAIDLVETLGSKLHPQPLKQPGIAVVHCSCPTWWRSSMARQITSQSKAGLLALALGAAAFGATAMGVLAIGRLVVGRLLVKHVHLHELEVDTLTVRRLRVVEREGSNP